MFHLIVTAQIAWGGRGRVGGMPGTSGSRTIIVKGAKFGIGSFCAIGARGAFISVAFDFSLERPDVSMIEAEDQKCEGEVSVDGKERTLLQG